MQEDPDGWHLDFDRAETVIVELFRSLGSATLTFESRDGSLDDAAFEFDPFPVDDFFDAGLNIIGPFLNRRGIAYTSWLEPDPDRLQATAFRWDGPEVDDRVSARRAGS